MRTDQREPGQMRPVKVSTDYLLTAEGSALIEIGNTRVLCAASVEESVPSFLRGAGKGWVTAEYSMLPRATATRTPREVSKGRQSGRSMEIQRLIGRSLRSVVDLAALGERSVIVYCATSNPGKLREFRMSAPDFDLRPIAVAPPEEHGRTFEENARAKAVYYGARVSGYLFADDSGIEVDALGGAPGVDSAHFD